ncbi:transient receptor potential cation channel subfamily V member 1-like [Sebastes umbrosus]|uniref:transient receptor potential cation channel subfamily V member 1-like n=1 Tax=Sebastes umbrosus TaxID=72105 RepID=UPI00189D7F38|nr:transient receptor potential cation channel subfamily V member 1-like [Sebastes umbrosus]
MATNKMDDGQEPDTVEQEKDPEEDEENNLDWLLGNDSKSEIIQAPMDTNVHMPRPDATIDGCSSKEFTRERVFNAASQGDTTQLDGLLDYLRLNDKQLTSPEFTDEANGKTALLKALLKLKDGRNDTVEVFLDIAEKTGDLENLINAPYTDPSYKGQTALHIAIERRSFYHVDLLVQKGADVQAKANGNFFQRHKGLGFYFGELPLSLAACTNQPDLVSFLIENSYRRADVTDKDSQGNTVLHALVVIADNTEDNTAMVAKMYDEILIQHNRLEKDVLLEAIENNKGMTPLKLAAKLGKIGLFKHMLQREFVGEEMRPLSRKFTEWVYGPVRSSLYDTSSIDTIEDDSVLEIVVFGTEIPNRPEMLQIEPLRSLLDDKWDRFAYKLFWMNFVVYLLYLIIFTCVAFYRKRGVPPFPIQDVPRDYFRCIGEIISVLGAVWFFFKAIVIFKRNPPTFNSLYTDGFCEILFFLQAILVLVCPVLYFCGRREYAGLLVMALALAWINVLYYSRGSKRMGMYGVMMERMVLGDLFHFLAVYSVMLVGFAAAIVAIDDDDFIPPAQRLNTTVPASTEGRKPRYNDLRFTLHELFKFTIGMGDLGFTDDYQYKEVFYILLFWYIVLTYILLLNMLIALMGHTVDRISNENENIWNLQRAFTILDMERTLPRCLRTKLFAGASKVVLGKDKTHRFFRVEELNWKQWRSDVGYIQDEDPGENEVMSPAPIVSPRRLWTLNPFLQRLRDRRHRQRQPSSSMA